MADYYICNECQGEVPYKARLAKRDCKGRQHFNGKCLSVDKRHFTRRRRVRDEWASEYSMIAGMAGGCEAYNYAMGWDVL